MTTPRDDIAGLIERLKGISALGLPYCGPAIREAATKLDALQARVKELEEVRERSWCTRCGTVTRDGECDCTIHGSCGEPNFVNYADAMQKSAREAHVRALRAKQERDEAYERAAEVAESVGRPVGASDGCGTYIPGTSADAARAIRRLAGPEKEGK